jgi:CRISPR-associated protein Cas1
VKKEGKIIQEYRTMNLKRILIFGNCQVTADLMRFHASKGVEVAFLSSRGKFQYRLVPQLTMNIFLRRAQYDRYNDMDFRLGLSKEIVREKIKNQRIFLIRSISTGAIQGRIVKGDRILEKEPDPNRRGENLKATHGCRKKTRAHFISELTAKSF